MSNSKWAKGLQSRLLDFPEGLLVAALYATACWSARQVSLDQFFLPAGIRIAALLVCRREMWPYLLVGEYAYFAYLRMPLVDMYGVAWAVTASVYQLPFVALIVHLHWRRKPGGTVRNFVFGHNMLKRIMYATQEKDRQGRCPSAAHPACRAR